MPGCTSKGNRKLDLPAAIAVTGAGGFLGSHLVHRLARMGRTPIGLTRDGGFDIRNSESLANAPRFDALIHLAARTFVPESRTNIAAFLQTNISGTLNVLELCRQNNARVVFLSSYVYGTPSSLPVDESHPTSHWNPYASSKLVGEEICRAFAENFSVPAVILRLFNVYGPGQKEHFLIPKIVRGAKQGEVFLHSSVPRRDFVHVSDVVNAIVGALGCTTGFHVFNVGSGASHSVRDIVQIVTQAVYSKTGQQTSVHYSEQERSGEVMDVVADFRRIREQIGWSPQIEFRTGLTELALSDD